MASSYRQAQENDSADIAKMLADLALEIGDGERFKSSSKTIRDFGFGKRPLFQCIIAENETQASVGLALYFPVFSTTRAEPGVYVQDLWVAPQARQFGVGKGLLGEVARKAHDDWGATWLNLSVYTQNSSALAFYKKLGFACIQGEQRMLVDTDKLMQFEGPG